MAIHPFKGRRLLPAVIDEIAEQQPGRAWLIAPVDDADLSKGFEEVTFKQFKDAIDFVAHWLDSTLGLAEPGFPTFAYAGPKDLRYPIVTVAAAKIRRKILLMSPVARIQAQKKMYNDTNCTHFVYATGIEEAINNFKTFSGVAAHNVVRIPSLQEVFSARTSEPYPYTKSWEEAHNQPWIIFHTSGTTGDPKLAVYTQQAMCSMDAHDTLRDPGQTGLVDLFRGSRVFAPWPALHIGSMIVSLQLPVWLQAVPVVGPSSGNTVAIMNTVIAEANVQVMLLTPFDVDKLTSQPDAQTYLSSLRCIMYGGAPLPAKLASRVPAHIKLTPVFGSTEAGICNMLVRDDDEWDYCSFMSSEGVHFDMVDAGHYEMVYYRHTTDPFRSHQQVFHVNPNVDIFRTKDLFVPHTVKPGLWKYVGRADDMIKLIQGESFQASELEAILNKHACIKASAVGGRGRPRSFALIEVSDEFQHLPVLSKLNLVADALADANSHCSQIVRIQQRLVAFTSPHRPLPRTQKGTVSRDEAFDLYEAEIEYLYMQAAAAGRLVNGR